MTAAKFLSCTAAILLINGCVSKEYKEWSKSAIDHSINEDIYKLTSEHLVCYFCEENRYPITVFELEAHRPKTEICKSVFRGDDFDHFIPELSSYKVKTKKWDNRTTIVFTRDGIEFEDLDSIQDKEPFMTMNLYDDDNNPRITRIRKSDGCAAD